MPAPVYNSINEFPGDGVTTQYEFNFAGGYISRDHVRAYTTNALGVITEVIVTPGMWVNDNTLDLGVAAPVGGITRIYRETPRDEPLVNFSTGSRLTEANLDLLARQTVLGVAEAFDAGAYAAANDLLGAAGAALAAAQQAEANAAASESAANLSAIAAAASELAAEAAQLAAEAARDDPAVQTVVNNIADITLLADNTPALVAALPDIQAAVADLPALAAKVSKTGDTMTGPLEAPAFIATSYIELPTWTTAGRPASPQPGWTGRNSDLGCNETYNGTDWVADGWVYGSSVSATGVSVTVVSSLPDWANEVCIHLEDVSKADVGVFYMRANSEVTGYKASSVVSFNADRVTGSVDSTGIRIESLSAANAISGQFIMRRVSGNKWSCFYVLGNNTSAVFSGGGIKTFSSALSTIAFVRGAPGDFDGGTFTPSWRA